MFDLIEMRNIAIDVNSLIGSISSEIRIKERLLEDRQEYLKENFSAENYVDAVTRPYYSILIDENKENIKELKYFKKQLIQIKDNLEKLEANL